MHIDNELLTQWEPKVQSFLSKTYIRGLDRADIAQELRIAIMKAAKGFNEDRGALFHTYLHTTMVNTIRTLLYKADRQLKTSSLEERTENSNLLDYTEILDDSVVTPSDDIDFNLFLHSIDLDITEQKFIRLRVEGMTMEEITQDIGESAYKIRQDLQEKVKKLL